jgi:hypothetical protein
MSAETAIHRAWMILICPLVFVMALVAYTVCAPLYAVGAVYEGFKKHWSDQ